MICFGLTIFAWPAYSAILNQKGGLIGKVLGPREWESEAATILFELLIKDKAAPAT